MAQKKTRTLLTTLIVILGCGVVGYIFWISDRYRAATPLVFIFGAIILLIPAIGSLIRLFMPAQKRTLLREREIQQRMRENENALWRNHIPQLVTSLYFGHIQQYPQWIRESRDYVPSSVTNAGRTDEGWVRLLLYYADYIFPIKEWQTPDKNNVQLKQGVLEVVREGVRVLTLRVVQRPDKGGVPRWEPVAIEGFHMGEWVRDFQNLKAEVLAIIKDREREAREN
jgi:hypothetical protein